MSDEKSYTAELQAEWIKKAEGDFTISGREIRARNSPNYDAICFHCEQCIASYLKAYLLKLEIPFSKLPNLPAHLDLVGKEQPLWETWRPNLKKLSDSAAGRYPGASADKQAAKEALTFAISFRAQLRQALALH